MNFPSTLEGAIILLLTDYLQFFTPSRAAHNPVAFPRGRHSISKSTVRNFT